EQERRAAEQAAQAGGEPPGAGDRPADESKSQPGDDSPTQPPRNA
ncbi:electron transport complex subunit RsxB, partial [Burkholderia sp. Cy-647]|nr:electron transport complex subunit RsxB [Burkholderia sp. Cy-647]